MSFIALIICLILDSKYPFLILVFNVIWIHLEEWVVVPVTNWLLSRGYSSPYLMNEVEFGELPNWLGWMIAIVLQWNKLMTTGIKTSIWSNKAGVKTEVESVKSYKIKIHSWTSESVCHFMGVRHDTFSFWNCEDISLPCRTYHIEGISITALKGICAFFYIHVHIFACFISHRAPLPLACKKYLKSEIVFPSRACGYCSGFHSLMQEGGWRFDYPKCMGMILAQVSL